jgi:hypothetical protein
VGLAFHDFAHDHDNRFPMQVTYLLLLLLLLVMIAFEVIRRHRAKRPALKQAVEADDGQAS